MTMNRRRAAIFFIFITFAALKPVLAATFSAEMNGEKIEFNADGRKWVLGSQHHDPDRGILEYVLPKESVDHWSEIVTINYFKGMKGPDLLTRFVGFAQTGLKKSCQNINWNELFKDDNSISYTWNAGKCTKSPSQSEVARVIRSEQGLYVLHYASKKVPMPHEKRTVWYSLFTKAVIKPLSPAA